MKPPFESMQNRGVRHAANGAACTNTGRNQPMRQRRRHRLGDPRRCRPAQSPRLPARDNIALMPLPPTAPELNPVDPSAALRASKAFDALRSRLLGESARQPARPRRLEQLRGDHRGVLRRPGTPLWPNPISWPQLKPEIGRRSRVKAVDFAVVQAVSVSAQALERRRRRTFRPAGNIVNANSSRTPSGLPTRSTSKFL
jgi:hypothetical protein